MKKNKEKNILLINPWIYDFTAYDYWSKPLGLLYVAAILKAHHYKVNFIDCLYRYHQGILKLAEKKRLKRDEFGRGPFYKEEIRKPKILDGIPRRYSRYGITEDIFLNEIKKMPKPQAVLVTSIMTYWYPGVFRIIKLIKNIYPDIPVILGGIYSTLCFDHAKEHSGADYIVKGSNIKCLLLLLENITGSESNNLQKCYRNLKDYPYPDWDLYEKIDYICMITSRGCLYRCSYCASNQLYPQLEFRNPIEVANEIDFWKRKRQVTDFVFYDDALLIHPRKYFMVFLDEIIRRKINVRFHLPNGVHAREIDTKIAEKMFLAGIQTIRLGFETVNPLVQKKTGGKIENKEFKKAVNLLMKAGFDSKQIGAYLLIGIPDQTIQEIKNSINFVRDCGAHPRIAKFSPIPGTKIWKEARQYFNFDEMVDPLLHNDALLPYISPEINEKALKTLKSFLKV